MLQNDFDKNGGIYYDLDNGGFILRDAAGDHLVAARDIQPNAPIVIARQGKNGQLEVLDPNADQSIINNTLAVKRFNPNKGSPDQNKADVERANQLFTSYLSRNADDDLKTFGINPEDIRSKAIQKHGSTKIIIAIKMQLRMLLITITQ